MKKNSFSMPFRQVHLDFHTSEHIPGIGEAFDPDEFARVLNDARVNSITVFSKCHHGLSYHPTKVGQMHPHLKRNLLGEQIDACRKAGIKTPVYISAGIDEHYYYKHPGVICVFKEGTDPLAVGFRRICLNDEAYLKYLFAQTREVLEMFECDGLFFDIVGVAPCVCRRCLAGMFEQGLDPQNDTDVLKYALHVQREYFRRIQEVVHAAAPGMRIFQNAGHISKGDRDFLNYVSHLEIESLPTGGWGYDHFPASAKYTAGLDTPYLGMTGKFHTTWGEFGGFKHPNALVYETSAMLAFGARCSIGDQLHPSGQINADTYSRIGLAYAEVEKKESFCTDVAPVAEIAVLSIEALMHRHGLRDSKYLAAMTKRSEDADTGAQRMLLEKQVLFDVIDAEADFSRYRLILIPDERIIDAELEEKLKAYVRGGGKLLLSYTSVLRMDGEGTLLNFGEYKGMSEFDPEYLQVSPEFLAGRRNPILLASPFVISHGSVHLAVKGEVLARKINPYFNRTIEHFCSHQHTPDAEASDFPGVVLGDSVAYFAHKIFSAYADSGQSLYRELVVEVIREMLGGLRCTVDMPSCGRVSLMNQAGKGRYVLHLLYAVPVKRGGRACERFGVKDIEVIEDIVPVSNIACRLRIERKIKNIADALTGLALPFTQNGNVVEFTVPEVNGHKMLTLNY